MQLRAATFNMQNGQIWKDSDPNSLEIDLDQTIEFIRHLDADVLFLQEVEQGFEGGRQTEPPPHFSRLSAALPDYHTHFGYPPINPDELPFGLGLAILSRFELTGKRQTILPAPDVTFEFAETPRRPSPRLLIEATATLGAQSVRLLNTHLQAFFMIGRTSEEFRGQRDGLEAQLKGSTMPTLLGGDFNCGPGEEIVAQLAKVGFQTAQHSEITWRRKPFILDHLFFNSGLTRQSVEVIPTTASDHHAVRATFELK